MRNDTCPITGTKLYKDLHKYITDEILDLGLAVEDRKHKHGEIMPLRFLAVDIDNLKNFNDFHGFPEGDNCIKKIGAFLLEKYGHKNVFRFNGDGFVTILNTNDAELELPHKYESLYPKGYANYKYSILEIHYEYDPDRHHQLSGKIMNCIEKGLLEATIQGQTLEFKIVVTG